MVEITLSTIHNDEHDLQAIRAVLDDFEHRHEVRVHLLKMLRGAAWTDLMSIASTGKGPDLSHIGSTWVSSLVGMNAVRAFKPDEVAAVGSEDTFIPSAWQDAHVIGDPSIWAAPWNSFLFVIFYRKDLLKAAGIAPETAFGNVDALGATIEKLRVSNIEMPWLIPYGAPPYDGLLHQAASWVWGAGGDFVSADGKRVILDQPAGIRGLVGWLDSQRAVPEAYRNLTDNECIELLVEGRAGAIVSHIRTASALIARMQGTPGLENIGFTAMSDQPWCAGDNLILWQHTQGYPQKQRTALELVHYLMSREPQVRLAHDAFLAPTRRDALLKAYPETHPLHPVALQAGQSGRAYLSMRLWRRIENQLAATIGGALQDAYQNPHQRSETIIRRLFETTAERLNLMLGN